MTSKNVFGASLSRRGFVKTGGSLLVGFSLLKADTPQKTVARPGNEINPALPNSWIEIHADNTILIRTGKSDFGQSTIFTAYRQIVAEELGVPFEAITKVISGDRSHSRWRRHLWSSRRGHAEHPQGFGLCSSGVA